MVINELSTTNDMQTTALLTGILWNLSSCQVGEMHINFCCHNYFNGIPLSSVVTDREHRSVKTRDLKCRRPMHILSLSIILSD